MSTSWEQLKKIRPVDEELLAEHTSRLLAEVRGYRLRELREMLALTQMQLASELDISQKRISEIERGDVERMQIDTLRRYVGALGGTLRIEVEVGDARLQIA